MRIRVARRALCRKGDGGFWVLDAGKVIEHAVGPLAANDGDYFIRYGYWPFATGGELIIPACACVVEESLAGAEENTLAAPPRESKNETFKGA